MFERLVIQNFQAHEKLVLDLDPTINTIIGPTDAGKSAVIRALYWVCFNRPNGDAYIRDGTEEGDGAKVTLTVDGTTVSRAKGVCGENVYTVGQKELEAFGQEVPDVVSKVLKVGAINFQRQRDDAYWFSESSGEVSKRLNAIVNLGIIDTTLAWFNKAAREAQAQIDVTATRLAQAKEQRKALAAVVDHEQALCRVELLRTRSDAAQLEARHARDLLQRAREAVQRSTDATAGLIRLNSALQAGLAWEDAGLKAAALDALLSRAQYARKFIGRKVPDIGALAHELGVVEGLALKRDELADNIREIRDLSSKAREARRVADALDAKLKTQMGNLCPLCSQKITAR